MGPQFSEISGTVLQILTISTFFSVADSTAATIIMAIDQHKRLAKWIVFEAALNLGLSIVLVKTIGIYGVALGTSIAVAVVHLTFWPRYIREVLGVTVRQFLWEGWIKITLCCVPYAVMCAVIDRYWHPNNLLIFLGQITITLPVYAICVVAGFRTEVRSVFRQWQISRLARA
jgi:O-antigen/teichoic acid export membrane protein